MKKVVINGRFLTHKITGVERCSLEIVRAIDRLIEQGEVGTADISFELVSPLNTVLEPNLRFIPHVKRGILSGHAWEQFELPWYSHRGFLLSLAMTSSLAKANQAVMIHDAAVFSNPAAFRTLFRIWYRLLLSILCRTARLIITPSQFSKRELMRYCGLIEDRALVVYEGREQISNIEPDDSIIAQHGLENKHFVLLVSSNSPNKNFVGAVKALEYLRDLDITFAIAGGTNSAIFNRVDIPSNIKKLGYVSDAQLKSLYSHAACFVFPSFYEGFGLPPLEAMSVGCPVIVSNTSSMPEVCSDAALYIDPNEPADIAEKIRRLMQDSDLREQMSKRGIERAEAFTWESTARAILNTILPLT